MKHRNLTVLLSLMLSLAVLLVAGPAFAECDVTPSTEATPFTYNNHTPSAQTMGVRAARHYKFRVGGVISAADAEKLLYAADLGHLNPDIDGNGEATLLFETTIDDVNEIMSPGDCEGVVFGPRNMFWAMIFAFDPNGRMEVPMFAFLTDSEPYIDGPKEAIESGAQIKYEIEQKQGTLQLKSEVKSADRQFYIKTKIEIPADAGFTLSTADLYNFDVPVWYATSPEFTTDPLWISYHRMEYALQEGDGSKVQIETRNDYDHKHHQNYRPKHGHDDDVGVVCFNQLSKATGQDLCVSILRAEGGSVVRREEAYQKSAP